MDRNYIVCGYFLEIKGSAGPMSWSESEQKLLFHTRYLPGHSDASDEVQQFTYEEARKAIALSENNRKKDTPIIIYRIFKIKQNE